MFILAYLLILILRANHAVVPHSIGLVVGVLAILEALFYIALIIINFIWMIFIGKDLR